MHMPSVRSLAIALAGVVGVVEAGFLALAATGAVPVMAALACAVSVVVAALLIYVVLAVRRLDAKVERSRHGTSERLGKLERSRNGTNERLAEVLAALGEDRVEYLTRNQEYEQRLDRFDEHLATISRVTNTSYSQMEALVDLRDLVRPAVPMPALRGWAASPDVVHTLVEMVWQRRPKLIVECGSGASTVWLGLVCQRVGEGRIVALEHDERYVRTSRATIRVHGLDGIVEVRHAPLQPWGEGDQKQPWYANLAVEDLTDIGLVFVDGPPQATGRLARYPAMPVLLPRCDPSAAIVLDDAFRADEQTISDRWMEENPELERIEHRHEKGTHVFRRRDC